MPHRILAALALASGLSSPALAQQARVVTDCAGVTLPARDSTNLMVDQNGKLCMSGTTTAGSLQPPTAAAGKITKTSTAISATTSTTIAAANANRIALGIQCASGGVSIDETGAALAAAGVGNGTLFISTGSGPYFTPPIATLTAITAYTGTAQTCVVTEYLR